MNGQPTNGHHAPPQRFQINTNTGVSVALMIVILGGFAWVLKGQGDNKAETVATKNELSNQATKSNNDISGKIDKLENRILNLESAKNSWTATDMFKWAVHLQQANPQIKVPESEVAK